MGRGELLEANGDGGFSTAEVVFVKTSAERQLSSHYCEGLCSLGTQGQIGLTGCRHPTHRTSPSGLEVREHPVNDDSVGER
jgi:hypothetical protein